MFFNVLQRVHFDSLPYPYHLQEGLWPEGVLPYNSEGGARRKISRTPLKGTRILFYGRVPKSFPPLRGTNSTTTNNITGTANFNSNIGFFESIALNLYPNKAYRLWQQTF